MSAFRLNTYGEVTSDVTVICGHITIYMLLLGNTAYCVKLSVGIKLNQLV